MICCTHTWVGFVKHMAKEEDETKHFISCFNFTLLWQLPNLDHLIPKGGWKQACLYIRGWYFMRMELNFDLWWRHLLNKKNCSNFVLVTPLFLPIQFWFCYQVLLLYCLVLYVWQFHAGKIHGSGMASILYPNEMKIQKHMKRAAR